jgi:CubicO group peptidase (beta-lactamase class C family)
MQVVNQFSAQSHLRSVLIKVTRGDQEIVDEATGESMTGVPATTDMHFRNGAVAISYMSTLLLILVDRGTVTLDDKVSSWLPDIPHSSEVTLGQLAQMTSGYVDFEQTPELTAANYADPFDRGQLCGSVPAVDAAGVAGFRREPTAVVRTGDQLELRAHQLRDPRPGAGEDHRAATGSAAAG